MNRMLRTPPPASTPARQAPNGSKVIPTRKTQEDNARSTLNEIRDINNPMKATQVRQSPHNEVERFIEGLQRPNNVNVVGIGHSASKYI